MDHLVQRCDDLAACRLHNSGWRINWFALSGVHHGAYGLHIAWRPNETGGTEPGQQRESADTPPGALIGAALPPFVQPEDVTA